MPTQKMYIERLTRLRDLVAGIRFTSKGEVRSDTKVGNIDRLNMSWWHFSGGCGSQACAIGHAMMDPWFRRRGFVGVDGLYGHKIPAFRGSRQRGAIRRFFGLSNQEVKYLFYPSSYPESCGSGPRARDAVVRRLNEKIKEKIAEL